ncbi:MAG: hypothetical protein H6R10_2025 [Rhodocyclaceae bacterium]|nr:hypothetical protein [Rhodocyclaceae bacterium]
MNPILVLPGPLQAEMEMLARRGYPRESCGLLLGWSGENGRHVVHYQQPGHNLAAGNDRYELDPEDYLAAEMAAKAAGLAIIGTWHSHPDHPARPSATDLALAWAGWSYVIIAVSSGNVAELRSWRLGGGDFAEEEIYHD